MNVYNLIQRNIQYNTGMNDKIKFSRLVGKTSNVLVGNRIPGKK